MAPPGKKKKLPSKADREIKLRKSGVTGHIYGFKMLCEKEPQRIGIVTEGDSWFAYPPKLIVCGPNSNIIDWIVSKVENTKKVNLLRLASNGDEAVNMISDKQKHEMAELLKTCGSHIHLLLFSGGGNDVVGKWDMERMLKHYKADYAAEECIYKDRLKRKLQRISLAYEELIELCREYSPNTMIVTHTYDKVKPSKKGAKFLWGRIKTEPWIHPYLVAKGIPENLHMDVTELLLGGLRDQLQKIADKPQNKNTFMVVDTYGTLRPGHGSDWINEIHPTSSGFKRITQKIYGEMRQIQPGLPGW